jgi:hypothetical protein
MKVIDKRCRMIVFSLAIEDEMAREKHIETK